MEFSDLQSGYENGRGVDAGRYKPFAARCRRRALAAAIQHDRCVR